MVDRRDYYKNYYAKNREWVLTKRKKYYLGHKEEYAARDKRYGKERSEAFALRIARKRFVLVLKRHRYIRVHDPKEIKLRKLERARHPIELLKRNLRSRARSAIKDNRPPRAALKHLGCSLEELRLYFESKFQPGMTWENYGFTGWHIDHIKPFCAFDLTDPEEIAKACHYTNLQPLWAVDNLKKIRYDMRQWIKQKL